MRIERELMRGAGPLAILRLLTRRPPSGRHITDRRTPEIQRTQFTLFRIRSENQPAETLHFLRNLGMRARKQRCQENYKLSLSHIRNPIIQESSGLWNVFP